MTLVRTLSEYEYVLRQFLSQHRVLIWLTSWLRPATQVKFLCRWTDAPWPVVHDAMYNRTIYQKRYELILQHNDRENSDD